MMLVEVLAGRYREPLLVEVARYWRREWASGDQRWPKRLRRSRRQVMRARWPIAGPVGRAAVAERLRRCAGGSAGSGSPEDHE